MLPGWSGEQTALSAARTWDGFRERLCARAGDATPRASLELWVASQAEGQSDGQRSFERASLLRHVEIERVAAGGLIITFAQLPPFAQTFLIASDLGAGYWAAPPDDCPYKSPLHAICSLNGVASRDARRQREDEQGLERGDLISSKFGDAQGPDPSISGALLTATASASLVPSSSPSPPPRRRHPAPCRIPPRHAVPLPDRPAAADAQPTHPSHVRSWRACAHLALALAFPRLLEGVIGGTKSAADKREAGGNDWLEYHDANMDEKRELVAKPGFTMDKKGLQLDLDRLGDWPNTNKDPTYTAPNERGQRMLVSYATSLGREGESTRGVRRWLLDHLP